jgi:hypothetical protein
VPRAKSGLCCLASCSYMLAAAPGRVFAKNEAIPFHNPYRKSERILESPPARGARAPRHCESHPIAINRNTCQASGLERNEAWRSAATLHVWTGMADSEDGISDGSRRAK